MQNSTTLLHSIFDATKPKRTGPIVARGHEQQLAVLIVAICLREIPDRALRLIVASSAQNPRPGVFVNKFVGPLPDISNHIHNAEWTCPSRVRIDVVRLRQFASLVWIWNVRRVPEITPWIDAVLIAALGRVLPLPIVWQPFSRPPRIGARIFESDPGHRLISPSLRICAILPILQKVLIILRMVLRSIQKLLEFGIRDRKFVHVESVNMHSMFVETPWRVFP